MYKTSWPHWNETVHSKFLSFFNVKTDIKIMSHKSLWSDHSNQKFQTSLLFKVGTWDKQINCYENKYHDNLKLLCEQYPWKRYIL